MNLANVEPAESGPRKLPPLGWRPMKIILSEAAESAAGNSMIKVQVLLTSEDDDGYIIYDNFLTDGSAKGAGFSVPKLQGLGIDTNEEISDDELAEKLLELEGFVNVKHEPIKDQDPRTGKYTLPRYDEDETTGKRILAKRAVAKGYSLQAPGSAQQVVSAPASAPPPPSQWGQPPTQPARPPPPPAPVQAPPSGPPSAVPPWMQQGAGAPPPPPAKSEASASGGRGGRKTK